MGIVSVETSILIPQTLHQNWYGYHMIMSGHSSLCISHCTIPYTSSGTLTDGAAPKFYMVGELLYRLRLCNECPYIFIAPIWLCTGRTKWLRIRIPIRASQEPTLQLTEYLLTNRLSCWGSSYKIWNWQSVPTSNRHSTQHLWGNPAASG